VNDINFKVVQFILFELSHIWICIRIYASCLLPHFNLKNSTLYSKPSGHQTQQVASK